MAPVLQRRGFATSKSGTLPVRMQECRRYDDQGLMRLHRSGNRYARGVMIERYLPLARALALRYRAGTEPIQDLVQVASLGLVKAVDRWEPERGFAFSTYATPTILGEVRRHFRDTDWHVRPPRRLQELCFALEATREELRAATGTEPAIPALAERLRCPEQRVVEAIQASAGRRAVSLDARTNAEDHAGVPDDPTAREDPGYARAEARATIARLIPRLDDRARRVLVLRFGSDLRQSDIGAHVGCSQMHVSRILSSSLDALQREAGSSR